MNIWMENRSEIGPDRKKRWRIIVTKEHSDGTKRIIYNTTCKKKREAQAEIVRAFEEIGAYV